MNGALARPRVLFLCQLNPWRLNNGGIIRNYWLVDALSRRFDVDLVTADDLEPAAPADFAVRCARIRCFPRLRGIRAKIARARGALRINGSYFTSGSVTPAMKAAVAELVATRSYSAIVTELGLADAIPATAPSIVYSSHNCEAALLMRRARLEPIWSRPAVTLDALRVRRLEAALVGRARLVTPCSPNDIVDTAAFAPSMTGKSVVIPNGVDCATYADVARTTEKPGVILITGSYDWLPNRRGLMWFLDEVLPIFEQTYAHKNISIRIAGRMSAEFAAKLNTLSPRLTAVANVPRMTDELRDASIVAVPVIASSGTRLRILEAWAAGRPIVTTPHGAFGLNFTDGTDLFSCPDARGFADAAVRLCDDESLRATFREAGLARAASYDWSAIGTKLIASFERFGLLPSNELQQVRADS